VCGVSTRRVDQLVESLGLRISKSEVGRIAGLLVDAKVENLGNGPPSPAGLGRTPGGRAGQDPAAHRQAAAAAAPQQRFRHVSMGAAGFEPATSRV
jgi:hypothetical protein